MCSRSSCHRGVWLLLLAAVLRAQPRPAEIELLQPLPEIELSAAERFAVVTVLFRNCGEQTLQVYSVRSECWCAAVTVLRGSVPPDSVGMLRVMLTAAGLGQEPRARLRFRLESNACNSPFVFELTVHRRDAGGELERP